MISSNFGTAFSLPWPLTPSLHPTGFRATRYCEVRWMQGAFTADASILTCLPSLRRGAFLSLGYKKVIVLSVRRPGLPFHAPYPRVRDIAPCGRRYFLGNQHRHRHPRTYPMIMVMGWHGLAIFNLPLRTAQPVFIHRLTPSVLFSPLPLARVFSSPAISGPWVLRRFFSCHSSTNILHHSLFYFFFSVSGVSPFPWVISPLFSISHLYNFSEKYIIFRSNVTVPLQPLPRRSFGLI